jgi:periplasmic mercuric ion binding protein
MKTKSLVETGKKQLVMSKTNILIVAFLAAMAFTSAEANVSHEYLKITKVQHDDQVTKTFKVFGNCGMCEKTIEGALTDVSGIVKADWDKETKMMEVTFHEHQITLDEIKKKIAAVGYDTEEFKATGKSYGNLPGCCQYER